MQTYKQVWKIFNIWH